MRGSLNAVLLFSFALMTGCAHHARNENPTQLTYVNKPIIDFGRGGGGMPIEGIKELKSAEDLLSGLTRGYRGRVDFPRDHDAILIAGQFPRLDLLRVDLSEATLKKDYRPRQFKKPSTPQHIVFVKQFESVAKPLRYHDGPMEWRIAARDAQLSLIKDGDQQSLVLTSVAEGTFEFSMKVEDIRPMLMAAAKEHSVGGFGVRDVHFDAHCEDEHTLVVDVKVDATWLLVPASFRIGGKVQIDDSFNVHLTSLRCVGLDIGGVLLAGFIDEALAKQNGKVQPLAHWPGNRIQLSGAKIVLDDHLSIKANFGPPPSVAAK